MRRKLEPTSGENVLSRLFLRYFLCFLCAVPFALLPARWDLLPFRAETVGTVDFLFIPLAALAAVLTVTKPYLLLLTVLKSFYDVSVLYRISVLTRRYRSGVLPWNACFFLLVFSLLLYCTAAARAHHFSFTATARDTALLLSRPFGRFLLETIFLVAISLALLYLWPQAYVLI